MPRQAVRHIPLSGKFNGVNAQATLADDALHDVGTSDFSLWARVKLSSSMGANPSIIGKYDNASTIGYSLYIAGGRLYFYIADSSGATSVGQNFSFIPSLDAWIDVAVTADRDGNVTFYVNGIASGTGAISARQLTIDNIGAMSIGNLTGFGYAKLHCAEAGLWKRVLTAAEMLSLTIDNVKPTGSTGLWKATPTQFEDISGNAKHLANINVTAVLDSPAKKRKSNVWNFNSSLSFDGNGDYVTFGAQGTGWGSPNKTVAFWAKPRVPITATAPILSNQGAGWYVGFTLSGSPAIITSYYNELSFQQTKAGAVGMVEASEWHLYAVSTAESGDDVTVKFYVDGIFVGQQTSTGGLLDGVIGPQFILGAFTTASTYFNGHIGGTWFWGATKTDAEMEAMYYDAIIPRTNLEGEWLMSEGSGTTVADTSGKGITGTIVNATWSQDIPA